MWHLERAKEMKLPATLRSWYNDARQKRTGFVQQLEQLETLAAQMPADYDELPETAAMAEPKPVVSDA